MSKLSLFRDQEDYVKELTNDKIINVFGTKGSGKTTLSLEYFNNDYIVINCDRLFDLPCTEKEDKELTLIRQMLQDKYGSLKMDDDFTNCYKDIVNYILKKDKKGLIEGNVLQNVLVSTLKGKVIIKRTSLWKSYIRAVKRDYQNAYFMHLEQEKHRYLYKLTRFYKICKRRKSIFNDAKIITKIMDEIDSI